jgi:hypothetical protein
MHSSDEEKMVVQWNSKSAIYTLQETLCFSREVLYNILNGLLHPVN